MNTLFLAAVLTAPPDEGSLASQRPPSQWKQDLEYRKALVHQMKVAKAKKESAARKYRLRQRQYATSRYVQAAYQYDRATLPTMAEVARAGFAYDQMRRLYPPPPSCQHTRITLRSRL